MHKKTPDSKMKKFEFLFRHIKGEGIQRFFLKSTNSIGVFGEVKIGKWHKNTSQAFGRYYNLHQAFARGDMATTEIVKHMFFEKKYFPKNMRGMVTENWRQKPQMLLYIKLPNESLERMCFQYFCETCLHQKKSSGYADE